MSWTTFDSSGASVSRSLSDTPIGTVQPYAGTAAPNGWLFCDGSSISTTAYPELFSAIGYTYGGSGASFSLPDLRGRVPAGKDDMGGSAASRLTSTVLSASNTLGATGGSQTHTLAAGELPAHTHPAAYAGYSNGTGTSLNNLVLGSTSTYLNDATQLTGRTGQANSPSGGSHNNTQPTIVLNYIIYAQSVSARIESVTPPQYVTSLPTAPVNGQEIYYVADSANGIIWHLRYNGTSSSSYKWEFLGGSYLGASIATLQSTTSTTYTDLTTSGPTVTPPLSGDYAIRVEAGITSTSSGEVGAFMSYAIGATAASDTNSISASVQTPGFSINVSREYVKNFSSGTALTAKYRGSASTVYFEKRVLAITPVRVG